MYGHPGTSCFISSLCVRFALAVAVHNDLESHHKINAAAASRFFQYQLQALTGKRAVIGALGSWNQKSGPAWA